MRLWRIALALRALRWVIVVEWQRRWLGFGDLVAGVESRRLGARSAIAASTARSAVRRVSHLLPLRRSCLRESLASVGLLRSLGHPARLAIGVKAPGDSLDAHAWVEVDGKAVGDGTRDYRVLARSPAFPFGAASGASNLSNAPDAESRLPTPVRTDSV